MTSSGPARHEARRPGKRVLVVEDERVVALDLQRTLIAFGYDVPATAASGDEALRLAVDQRPDLVLMDVRLEGAPDGIDAAALLRRQLDVPVVFLTAYADEATLERAKGAEPLGYLVKPVKAEELRSTVEIALQEHGARARLARSERWLTTVLRSIDDAVISTDAGGRVDGMNPAGERLTGWRAPDAVGRAIEEVLPLRAVDGDAALRPVERALQERRVVRIDSARLGAEGEPRFVADSAAPILDDAGAVSGAVLVLRDDTEPRRLRRQLELVDRLAALGTLAAGVAHEINNPLAWVLLNVELARRALVEHRAALPPVAWVDKLLDGLADAEAGAERVRRIVADLRRFTAPAPAERRLVDVAAALRWAIEVTRGEIERRARLEVRIDELPPVAADETRLGQVFVNLLVNAAHAIEPGRAGENQVVACARAGPDGAVEIEVRDSGRGMSDEVRRRVFEPFFTTKPSGEGSGLGLAITHGIVTALGGELTAESRPGAGSVFRVRLPAVERVAPGAGTAEPVVASPPSPVAVLIIDDEPLLRRVLRRYLDAAGHEAVDVGSAREALELVAGGRRFDLVLCDLMMPEMTGMELHAELAARFPDQARRMVFMTGGAAMAAVGAFREALPNALLEKPFAPEALAAVIDAQLAALGRAER